MVEQPASTAGKQMDDKSETSYTSPDKEESRILT